jgi:adenylate kinase family enzyme
VRRVAIIGKGGAGKSWLALRLGERLGLPVIHLDRHYWRPGWTEPAQDEWRARQQALLDEHDATGWIADGQYGSTLDVRLARADTVVFLDPHPLLACARILRRQLFRTGAGLPALRPRWGRDLLEFLRYVWRYRRDRLSVQLQRIDAFEGDVYFLRSRRDVQRFLASLPRARDGAGPGSGHAEGHGAAHRRVPPLRRQA